MNQPNRKLALLLGVFALAGGLTSARNTLAQNAHPAVVRVIAPDREGVSLGSGALVAVSDSHGLVVTNWHVVRDAAGPITVAFPNGFRSAATTMKLDRDWDLAALAIWRPNVGPIRLADRAPQLGEVLTIAGYGQGTYRETAGRCVQYVSPGGKHPFQMVELSTSARQGDSGGPILNSRGELAGVLFGSSFGRTTGSYCGRVRWFLEEPLAMLRHLPPHPALIAQSQSPEPPRATRATITPEPSDVPATTATITRETSGASVDTPQPTGRELAELPPFEEPVPQWRELPQRRQVEKTSQQHCDGDPEVTAALEHDAPAQPPTRGEQIKTILAAIGLLALLFHGLRFVALAAQ